MDKKNLQIGFALGRDTVLSVAEIFAYLESQGVDVLGSAVQKDVLLLELSADSLEKISINALGGTIKIFRILGGYNTEQEIVEKLLSTLDDTHDKRVNFGVSGYGNVNKSFILKVGYDIKNALQEAGHSARFVTGKTVDLSSVIVNENKLIERGFEAIILKQGGQYLLGTTTEVQDYKAYSKRDFGRPKRDARNVMLPPKLAQIMINLAVQPTTATLYDPFCGSGTIIQEGLFRGFRDVHASDIEDKNIEDTKENLEWLYQRFGMPRVDTEKIFKSDVLTPAKTVLADAIVGEGYLGEPRPQKKDRAIVEAQKLAQFYTQALTNLAKQLKPGGTIVLAIPFFIVGREFVYLPILEEIERIGLDRMSFIPDNLELRLFGRGNLTYSRPDQFVGREILVLKKSS